MTRTYRWARRAVWGTLAVVLTIGCNPLTTIAFLTHKDVKVPAEAPLVYKDGEKKDQEDIRVAVFVTQGIGQSFEFANAADALASELAKTIAEFAKENKQKIVVIPTVQVNRFKMKHPEWKVMHPSKRGKELGADFVIVVDLERMTMFKPGTRNEFYEGRADVTVDTYQVDQGVVDPYTYVHSFAHPKTGFSDASSKPVSAFRREFLEVLAVELARHHFEHKPSSGIAEGR